MIVFIDSGVIGLLSNPNDLEEAIACENWLYTMLLRGVSVYSSDLCDYEVRRSLVLASQTKSDINRIPKLNARARYNLFLTYYLSIITKSLFSVGTSS